MRLLLACLLTALVDSDPLDELRRAANLTRAEFAWPRLVHALASRRPLRRPEHATETPPRIDGTVDGLWDAIAAQPYTAAERARHAPRSVNGEIWRNTMSNHNFITRTSTTSPCPHAKTLHAFGAWAQVRWTPADPTPYDGLWARTTDGMVRASRNGLMATSDDPRFAASNRDAWDTIDDPALRFRTKFSLALRLCPTAHLRECEDVVFLPPYAVDWERGQLFAQPQHTNVTMDPWTTAAFQQVSERPGEVRLDHVGKDRSPSSIVATPSKALVAAWREGEDWREAIATLGEGTPLYAVRDQDGRPIGTLTQTSTTWIASEVGDSRVTFHHHLDEERNLDFRPVRAPRDLPLSWLFAPNLVYVLNSALYRANPQLDPLFGAPLAPWQRALVNALPAYVVMSAPSRVSLLNYMVNSTDALVDFARRNVDLADLAQAIGIGVPSAFTAGDRFAAVCKASEFRNQDQF